MNWREILGAEKREIEPLEQYPQYPQNPTRAGNSEDFEDIELKGTGRKSRPAQDFTSKEAALLYLTLTEFERQDSSLAFRVPWLKGELWLAQDEEAAAELAATGVSRGRVFTMAELRDLMSIPGLTADHIRTVAQVKAEFSGRVTEVRPTAD